MWLEEFDMAINDIWEFVLVSFYKNTVECLNRFIYEETLAGDQNATHYAQEVWDFMKVNLRPLISTAVTYTEIRSRNLTDGVLLGTYAITSGNGGTVSSEALPSFVSYSFRMNRASGVTRHGYKRFQGVPETANTDGVLASAFATPVASLAADLGGVVPGVITGNTAMRLTPRIRSLFLGGEERPSPVIGAISSVAFVGFGTQNTRKH